MAIDKNSVSYIKEYLKYALEFEKYVYIWSQAMDEVNSRIRQIYSERKQLENTKVTARQRLTSLEDTNERQRRYKESEASQCRKNARTALILGFVFIVILPICIGIHFFYKNKAATLEEEAKQLSSEASAKRQKIILQAQESQAENDWIVNNVEETVINQRQEEIHNALVAAKNSLMQIYSENVLPQKYRTLTAVATLYEYLETGRCNTIQGHGGIYDTYEVESLHLAQLQQMVQMNQTLSRMEDNQRYICQELRQANRTLSSINASLNEIEKTNAEIAKNTAISAAANQQTAAATSWLAWRAWANGY